MSEIITEFRKSFTDYVKIISELNDQDKIHELAVLRKYNDEIINEHGIFYISKMAEMIVPGYIDKLVDFGVISPTNNKPIYSDRYVIPIYDMSGLVMGLVGYSLSAKERYMYSNTRYFHRNDILYGLENYKQCLIDGYAIVTEGITDAIRLKELGFKNVLSTAGAHKSTYMMELLNQIGIIIFIPDRDRAGDGTKNYWITDNYARLLVPFTFKDVDEFAISSDENRDSLIHHINVAISYMRENKEKGILIKGEELPIYG